MSLVLANELVARNVNKNLHFAVILAKAVWEAIFEWTIVSFYSLLKRCPFVAMLAIKMFEIA